MIPDGSFHFLIGPSGSGKSTFLNLCSYNLFPSEGEVEVFGQDTKETKRDDIPLLRRKIGWLPQNTQFIEHLTVFENVILPAIVSGLRQKDERENVHELLSWVGLADRMDALPQELSGGEQQRVALARAVIMAPDIVLADEPTGNVDWEMGQKLLSLLIQLNTHGKTVVIATHDFNLIRAAKGKVKTRILRLNNGKAEVAGSDL